MKLSTSKRASSHGNRLFPVFVKLENLRVIIVGGGKVAEEKLRAILDNAPGASVRIISKSFLPCLRRLSSGRNIKLMSKPFEAGDLDWADIVFSAVNNIKTSTLIHQAARKRRILHNAADKPALCDFYLGSVVQKGNLKIGISTNGKSPTIAKRLKAILDHSLPNEIDDILNQLATIRNSLHGDLTTKIHHLNAITSILATESTPVRPRKKRSK